MASSAEQGPKNDKVMCQSFRTNRLKDVGAVLIKSLMSVSVFGISAINQFAFICAPSWLTV